MRNQLAIVITTTLERCALCLSLTILCSPTGRTCNLMYTLTDKDMIMTGHILYVCATTFFLLALVLRNDGES
ncbi:hypothetical protein BDW68DRAFT_20530 [Aspergillus falconensis]